MKNLILCSVLLCSASCGPYYIGRRPADLDLALAPTESVLPATAGTEYSPNQLSGGNPPGVEFEQGATAAKGAASPDVWGAPHNNAATTEAAAIPVFGFDGKEVEPNALKLHELESANNTRGNLVKWYAEAMAKNESLETQLESERANVDLLYAEISQLRAVAAADAQLVATLRAEVAAHRTESEELEGRLVTAQIRRLEAEKLLLIDRLRAGTAEEPEQPATTNRTGLTVADAGSRL